MNNNQENTVYEQSGKNEAATTEAANKKHSHKVLRTFLITILIGGLLGGVAGVLISRFDQDLYSLLQIARLWLVGSALWLMIACSVVLLLAIWFFYRRGQKFCRAGLEADSDFEKADRAYGAACSLAGFGMIILFMFYGILVSLRVDMLYGIVVFLGMFAILIPLQGKIIRAIQQMCPEKQGDYLSKTFNKEWLDSCDEAERFIIYAASYKAYCATHKAFIFTMVALIFLSMMMDIGVLPFLIVGVLWTVQLVTYTIHSIKLEHGRGSR